MDPPSLPTTPPLPLPPSLPSPLPSTTTSLSFAQCSEWLESRHVQGMESVEFRDSDSCQSYGCYAKKDFNIGDIIFEIPQECLFGFHLVHETILTQVILTTTQRMNLQTTTLSPELILWLHMIEQRCNEALPFHAYFSSLSPLSPTIDNWPSDYLQFLDGTNLASTLSNDHDSLDSLLVLLNEIWSSYEEVLQHPSHSLVPNRNIDWKINIFTPSSLRWARGQYLSRRYPERFVTIDEKAVEFRKHLPSQNELSFGKMGVMVPLLDILNHNDQAEWLDFKIQDTNSTLQIICNYPVKMVDRPLSLTFIV